MMLADHGVSAAQARVYHPFFLSFFFFADIDLVTRKIAVHLSQTKVIIQEEDKLTIKTLSTFRNYEISLTIGEEFDEYSKGLDNRMLKVGMNILPPRHPFF